MICAIACRSRPVPAANADGRRRGQEQNQLLEQVVVERAEELRGAMPQKLGVASQRRQVVRWLNSLSLATSMPFRRQRDDACRRPGCPLR